MNISTYKVILLVFATSLTMASFSPCLWAGPPNTPMGPGTPAMVNDDCSISYVREAELDFVPVLRCQYQHWNVLTYAPPLFADIDGDGQTEIVAALHNGPDGFVVINPLNCQAEHTIDIGADIKQKDGGMALGDVDGNGYVDIFIEGDTKVQRWEYDPSCNQIQMVWSTDFGVAVADRSHLDILDLNQDGNPELIPNVGYMIDAKTGYVYPGMLPVLHTEGKGLFAFTADAEPGVAPTGQGNVELIYGTHLYRYDFLNEEWVNVRSHSSIDWGMAANVSIADMDLDGDVDAVITQWSNTGQALIWDMQTDELLGGGVWDYPGSWGSRMNIANMDEDEYPEMVMTSRYAVFAIDDINQSGGFGNIAWLDMTSDESGHTQITSFDFDGNGTYEAAYRDETKLRIFSGMGSQGGSNYYPNSPKILLDSGNEDPCNSYTGMEYPTIGDIDNDNEAEIVSTCWQSVNVYESGSRPWGNATSVWNTQAFNVTNVNQDGTIPAVQVENYKVYNNFLAQVNTNERFDTVVFFTPDAILQVTDVVANCDESYLIETEICNQGAAHIPAGTPLSFYWNATGSPEVNHLETLHLLANVEVGECITRTSTAFSSSANQVKVFALINDNGEQNYFLTAAGGLNIDDKFPMTSYYECSYTNNIASKTKTKSGSGGGEFYDEICPDDIYTRDGNTYTEPGTYTYTLQTAAGCDSLVTLVLEESALIESMETASFCPGQSFMIDGNTYTEAGTYTYYKETQTNCGEMVTLILEERANEELSLNATVCPGESYTSHGNTFTAPGTYNYTLSLDGECNTDVTLVIEELPYNETTLTASICPGTSYTSDGNTYTEAGTYTYLRDAEDGCQTEVTLVIEELPFAESTLSASICPGSSFTADNGQTYTEAGTYTYLQASDDGCQIEVTLVIEELPYNQSMLNATICEGESYISNGTTYTEPGTYTYMLSSEDGCETEVTLVIEALPHYENTISATICEGESYVYEGNEYDAEGVYTVNLQSMFGCDSLVSVALTVQPPQTGFTTVEVCEGEAFVINGVSYNEPGTYETTLQSVAGCDSLLTFAITVSDQIFEQISAQICEGETYAFGETTYSESGTYLNTTTGTNGCDVVTELTLEVLEPVSESFNVTLCLGEAYEWAGTTYHTAGTYFNTFTSAINCDSTVALNLQFTDMITTNLVADICSGEVYEFNGETYTESGEYSTVLSSEAGCDSTVALVLNVLPAESNHIEKTICFGETYTIGDQIYATSGVYTETVQNANGCENTTTTELIVLPPAQSEQRLSICEGETAIIGEYEYNQTGVYTTNLIASNGCDSTHTLYLEVSPNDNVLVTKEICEGEGILIDGTMRTEAGVYYETFQNINDCDSVVTYHVEVRQMVELEGTDAAICEGESVKLKVSGSQNEYKWFPSTGLSCDDCPNPIASPQYTTTYIVSSIGCMDQEIETEITVEVKDVPELETGGDLTVAPGQSVLLSAYSPTKLNEISWITPKEELCEHCPEVSVTPDPERKESTYFAKLTSDDGCVAQDTVTVSFRYDCIDDEFFIPNMITPNGDGVNDFFYIEEPSEDVNMRWLRIYNRWGELVFNTTDFSEHWDGKHRGEALNPGVYVYYLEISCPDNKPFQKFGNVTIIR